MENLFETDLSTLCINDETMDITVDRPEETSEALVEGLVRMDYPNIVLIGAQPKLGKTHFALDLCTEIARGGSFLGYKCKQGKTLYVNLDSSEFEIRRRLKALRVQKNLTVDEMRNFSHITLSPMPISRLADAIIRSKKDSGLSLVVIDSVFDCYVGPNYESYDENSSGDAALFTNQIKRLSASLKCPVALVHHFRKASADVYNNDTLSSFRGSGVITASADTLFALSGTHINENTRQNIQNITGEVDSYLKGVTVTITARSYESPDPFRCWIQDGIYHRDAGEFVKGSAGRPKVIDSDRGVFDEAFNELANNGMVKVSLMGKALGLDVKTVKNRALKYGYIRPRNGYIAKEEA